MHRIAGLLATVGLVLVCLFLASCGSNERITSDSNSGLNGGFELAEDGYPVNWAFGPDPESLASYEVSIDTTRFSEGEQSLRVDSTQDDQTKVFRSQRIPVQEGAEYRISFDMMNEGCSLRVRRTTMDASGTTNLRQDTIVSTSESTTEWTRYEEQLVAAEGESKVFLTFLVDGVGTVWCDGVRVEEDGSE